MSESPDIELTTLTSKWRLFLQEVLSKDVREPLSANQLSEFIRSVFNEMEMTVDGRVVEFDSAVGLNTETGEVNVTITPRIRISKIQFVIP